MKVLHFKTNYLNQSELFIDRLIRNHQQFEPIIGTCYPRYYTEDLPIYSMPNSPVLTRWRNKIRLNLNKSPTFLYKVVETEQPDLIHGHFGLDSYRLIELKNYFDLPFIVSFYGYDVIKLPREFGWKWRYKKLAREANLYFVCSTDMKDNVINLGFPTDRIRTLRFGMPIDKIEFMQRESAGPNIMMVGRMVEKKGFQYAIKAVYHLQNKGLKVNLDLYGDGERRGNLEQLAHDLGIDNQVTFHGQVDNDMVFDELYNHDVLLVPSVQAEDGDREGLPNTAVEGMATGIPVIASDHSGLPELVEHRKTGLQVPERDSEALSKAIQTYLNRPSLVAKISRNGREKVEQEHDITKQVKKAEDWYKSVL